MGNYNTNRVNTASHNKLAPKPALTARKVEKKPNEATQKLDAFKKKQDSAATGSLKAKRVSNISGNTLSDKSSTAFHSRKYSTQSINLGSMNDNATSTKQTFKRKTSATFKEFLNRDSS
jgi:hypothetical protein